MTTPLITLDEAKAFIGIRPTDTSHDEVLPSLILTATLELEKATGRVFTRKVHSEIFRTRRSGYDAMSLIGSAYEDSGLVRRSETQRYHLKALFPDEDVGVQVFYDPSSVFGSDTLLTSDAYRMDWDDGILYVRAYTGDYDRALKVIYTAGIEKVGSTLSKHAPPDLKTACKFQTAFLYKRHQMDNVGMAVNRGVVSDKTNINAAHWNVRKGLCQEAQGFVTSYRRPILGRG